MNSILKLYFVTLHDNHIFSILDKTTLTKTKGKQSFLEVARSFENPPTTGRVWSLHNDKKNERKKERKKERSATRISYRPNIVLLGIQQGMEGTIDEFISREQFSSFLCPYFCFEHGVRTREEEEEEEKGLTMRHAFIRGVYREKAGRLVGKGAEGAHARGKCVSWIVTRDRSALPRSLAPLFVRCESWSWKPFIIIYLRVYIELEN